MLAGRHLIRLRRSLHLRFPGSQLRTLLPCLGETEEACSSSSASSSRRLKTEEASNCIAISSFQLN